MTLWCRRITMPLTSVCSWRISGKGLQGAAEAALHVLGQQAWGGAQPVWLFPASLSRLAQASGAAGSTDCPVVHLNQEEFESPRGQRWHCTQATASTLLAEPCPVLAVALPLSLPHPLAHPLDGQRGDAQHGGAAHAQHQPRVGQHEVDGGADAVVILLPSALPSACHLTCEGQESHSGTKWWFTPSSHTSHLLLPQVLPEEGTSQACTLSNYVPSNCCLFPAVPGQHWPSNVQCLREHIQIWGEVSNNWIGLMKESKIYFHSIIKSCILCKTL